MLRELQNVARSIAYVMLVSSASANGHIAVDPEENSAERAAIYPSRTCCQIAMPDADVNGVDVINYGYIGSASCD